MKLLELSIQGVPPFKKATLDLAYEGITVIHGLNKDAGSNVTNAAGKSALVGSIPELILDEAPNGKDEKIKKPKGQRGLKVKTQKRTIKLQRGDSVYEITQTTGKAKSYEIIKNGKSIDVRTVNYSQDRIKKLFGMSSDSEFYSRFYIDSTITHPLIVGAGRTGRQDFLVELFKLDNIDHVRKLLNAELSVLTKKAVELRTINTSLGELREDLLPKDKRQEMTLRKATLEASVSSLTSQIQAGQKVMELLSFERGHKSFILELKTLTSVDGIPEAYTVTKNKVKKLKAQREAAADWSTYDRLVRLYEKAKEPATAALAAAGVSESDVKEGCEEYRDTAAELKQLERTSKDPGPKPKKVDEPEHPRDKCLLKVGKLKEELRHAKELKSGVCPTCGSKVNPRPVATIQEELAKWSRRIEKTDSYAEYTEAFEAWTSNARAFEQFGEKRDKLQKRLKRTRKFLELQELLESVPPVPRKPEDDRPEGFDEKKLERLQERLNILQQGKDLMEPLQALAKLTDKERAKAERTNEHLEHLNTFNAELSGLTAGLAQQEEILRRVRNFKSRSAELEEECKDEKILRALVNAHSSSGLKRFMVERYSKLLETQINKYRKMFFSEDYEFEFRYDTKLSLLVHRKYAKKTSVSDVRKLSGAEKRLFTLLLYVATSTMIPVDQRPNVLILDEPEANMGPPFVEQLIRALPLIQKLVPHILYVTPQTHLEIPNSRVFTVVKHHGVAELKVGRVVPAPVVAKTGKTKKEKKK